MQNCWDFENCRMRYARDVLYIGKWDRENDKWTLPYFIALSVFNRCN